MVSERPIRSVWWSFAFFFLMVTGSVTGSDPDLHPDSEPTKDLGLEQAKYCNAVTSAEVSTQDGDLVSRGKGDCPETGGMDSLSVSI